jgi:hypothetical protein
VLVQGVSRLHYGAVTPLYEGKVGEESWEMAVHRHYVVDSLSIFLLYFLQLAIMATYISQDLLKICAPAYHRPFLRQVCEMYVHYSASLVTVHSTLYVYLCV